MQNYSLQHDICALITDLVDMPTLTRWRAACRSTYCESRDSLHRDRSRLLMQFVTHPQRILALLTQFKGIIGGEFALSFLLREGEFQPTRLDIYFGESMFSPAFECIIHDPSISLNLAFEEFNVSTVAFAHTRDVRRSAIFYTFNGARVYIHESVTASPLSPTTRMWCTGLMNFVTEFSYGCAYPCLTFNRESLVSDFLIEGLRPDDTHTMTRMTNIGFVFVNNATQLPRYGHHAIVGDDTEEYRCMANRYICPDQPRYFGDNGSFVAFFDPFDNHASRAASHSVAPFGHMGAWRLWSSGICDKMCLRRDNILPRGVIAMPSVLVPNSVFRPMIHYPPPYTRHMSRGRLEDGSRRRASSS